MSDWSKTGTRAISNARQREDDDRLAIAGRGGPVVKSQLIE